MAIPSAFGPNRSSNQFGAGSLSGGLSNLISSSGGLGNTLATPVGRSSFDPQRQAEQAMRRARQQGNFAQAFQIGSLADNQLRQQQQFGQEQQGWQKVAEMYDLMKGGGQQQTGASPSQPQSQPMAFGAASQAGWGNVGGDTGTREGNVAAAKASGNFDAIRSRYNQMAKNSGQTMDEQGNIVPITQSQGPTPGQAFIPTISATGVVSAPKPVAPGDYVRRPKTPAPGQFVLRR